MNRQISVFSSARFVSIIRRELYQIAHQFT
jgi:hypothetical protein